MASKATLPDIVMAFMAAPEFQRLRHVRQLGLASHVFPTATHTRFGHSIGVSHLAGQVAQRLTTNIRVTELVQLAGLYHDVGHFAYSHLFDDLLHILAKTRTLPEPFCHLDHETRSIVFLRQVNRRLGLLNPAEEQFVRDCIMGHTPEQRLHDVPIALYQIVNNRQCGLDVDKIDYLERDMRCCFGSVDAGFRNTIVNNATMNEHGCLAFPTSIQPEIDYIFQTRKRMFQQVYHHPHVVQLGRIYLCMMSQLGADLFADGTDDAHIEARLRCVPEFAPIFEQLAQKDFTHTCAHCDSFWIDPVYRTSGHLELVPFVAHARM